MNFFIIEKGKIQKTTGKSYEFQSQALDIFFSKESPEKEQIEIIELCVLERISFRFM